MTHRMYDRFFDLDTVEYDFFYKPTELEKTAATKVSRSSSQWELDILKKLAEEKPFVLEGTDYLIKFKELDGDRGYAFGSVIISNVPPSTRIDNNAEHNSTYSEYQNAAPSMQDKASHVFIPVIIKDFKLDDFDIFVQEGQPRVLTEQNFARYMFNPSNFGSAVRTPGRNQLFFDETADKQSPPYSSDRHQVFRSSGFISYASAGMSKEAQGQTATAGGILEQLLPTIRPEHRCRLADHVGEERHVAPFAGTPALEVIDKILKGGPLTAEDEVIAFKDGLPKNVVRIERTGHDEYTVTCTNDTIYDPQPKSKSLVELLDKFKGSIPELGSTLAGLPIGREVVLTIDHDVRPLLVLEDYTADPQLLPGSGPALAVAKGGDIIQGHYLQEVFEPNGDMSPGHLFMSGDNWAYQTEIVGEPTSFDAEISEGSLDNGVWGTFLFSHTSEDSEGNSVSRLAALTPFKILATSVHKGQVVVKAQDVYSNWIHYVITPGVQKIVNLTGNDNLEVGMWQGANAYALPKWYKFVALGQRIHMEDSPERAEYYVNNKILEKAFREGRVTKEQEYSDEAGARQTLVIKYAGEDNYVMQGEALVPITKADSPSHVTGAKALYYLILLGADTAMAQSILQKARDRGRITVSNCKNLQAGETKLATVLRANDLIESAVAELNRDLTKEAAHLAAEDSVDSILSLSFINPENLTTYLQNMERLENAENDLAQLLLLVRLGLSNVSEAAVVNALRNLADVNEDLRFVNFLIENSKITTDVK